MEPDTATILFCGSVYRQADTDRERQVPYRTIQPNYTLQPPRRTLWVLLIKEATKRGYKEAAIGDTVDLGYAGSNTRRGRVGHDIAHTWRPAASRESWSAAGASAA
mgnify:FL=1